MNKGKLFVIGIFIVTFIYYFLTKKKMFRKISKNFYWYEMFVTNTGINNSPQKGRVREVNRKLQLLADNLLQPVRNLIGRTKTTSVFRNEEVNTDVGGVKSSQHYKAEAADIIPLDMDIEEAFHLIRLSNIPYDQIILETNSRGVSWIHISYKHSGGRKVAMIATWNFNKNKMDYRYA